MIKKISLAVLISLICSITFHLAYASEVSNLGENSTASVTLAQEEYEPIANVNVIGICPTCNVSIWGESKKTLYKGVNTCDAYYLKGSDGYFYPVRKNNKTTFQKRDVSEYTWFCKCGDNYCFFDY